MTKNAVENVWDKIEIQCMNHDRPCPMVVLQNEKIVKTPFYRCGGENICANRMNLDDYQDVVLKFLDHMAEEPFSNYTNYSFRFRGHRHSYRIQVLEYSMNRIVLGVWNLTILGKKNG